MSNVLVDKQKIDILANAISIKSGVPVTMTLDEMVDAVDNIIDTSDATADAGSILEGRTAYVNGEKITGLIPQLTEMDGDIGYYYFDENGERKWGVEGHLNTNNGGVVYPGARFDTGVFTFNAIPANTVITPTSQAQTVGGANWMMEGAITINPSSGGASNFITGTFTGTTAQEGTAIDIDIPYTGSGYPVSIVIYPSDGPYNSDSTFYNLIQRHVCCYLVGIKSIPNATPTYSSSTSNNMMVGYQYRKNSTSSATTYAGVATTGYAVYLNDIATPNNTLGIARFKSATRLSVFIADTSYGFAAGIKYTYQVVYSG